MESRVGDETLTLFRGMDKASFSVGPGVDGGNFRLSGRNFLFVFDEADGRKLQAWLERQYRLIDEARSAPRPELTGLVTKQWPGDGDED